MKTLNEIEAKIYFDKFKQQNFNWNIKENQIFNESFFKYLNQNNIYFEFTNIFLKNIAVDTKNIITYINYSLNFINNKNIESYLDIFLDLYNFKYSTVASEYKKDYYIDNVVHAYWLFKLSKKINIEPYIINIFNKVKHIFSFNEFINLICNVYLTEEFYFKYYNELLNNNKYLLPCIFKQKPSLTFFKKFKNIQLVNILRSPDFQYTTTEIFDIANIMGVEDFNNYFKIKFFTLFTKNNIIFVNDNNSYKLLHDKDFYYFQKVLKQSALIF